MRIIPKKRFIKAYVGSEFVLKSYELPDKLIYPHMPAARFYTTGPVWSYTK